MKIAVGMWNATRSTHLVGTRVVCGFPQGALGRMEPDAFPQRCACDDEEIGNAHRPRCRGSALRFGSPPSGTSRGQVSVGHRLSPRFKVGAPVLGFACLPRSGVQFCSPAPKQHLFHKLEGSLRRAEDGLAYRLGNGTSQTGSW